MVMRRRDLLKAVGASLAAIAAPRIVRAERPNKLVFGVHVDLSVLDPVVLELHCKKTGFSRDGRPRCDVDLRLCGPAPRPRIAAWHEDNAGGSGSLRVD
jgi:hypothetical protein